jgi:diaminopimelate decarboxylase
MEKKKFEYPVIKRFQPGMPGKSGLQPRLEPITEINNTPVTSLLEEYGSPMFLIREDTIRDTYQSALQAFKSRYPKVQFAWSYKTNYLDAVCRVFHDEGSWAEVVSGFEYIKAKENGVPGKQIIFNGPDKSRDDLEMAVRDGAYIHLDHFDEMFTLIELTNELRMKAKVAIRINMDTGIFPKWDRFGFNYENGEAWEALKKIAGQEFLELVGLHTHIGTYVMSVQAYAMAAKKLSELALRADKNLGNKVKYIDMGGGFTSMNTLKGAYHSAADTNPGFNEYADAISYAIMSSGFQQDELPVLILETGRAMIDDAGYLLGSVLATKRLTDGRRATVLDFGVNILFTSFWYDHEVHPGCETSDNSEETTLYGPLCMNIDVIRQNLSFPLLKKGDPIVLARVGAYNMTQWMQFITYRPNVVMMDLEGKTHIIRQKEGMDDLKRAEIVPDYLKQKD